MKFLLDYLDYIIEAVVADKSRIYYSKEFRSILKRLKDKSPIASDLLELENNSNQLDSYTLIDVTDKNDTISFVQVSRILRKYPDMNIDKELFVNNPKSNLSMFRGGEFWKEGRSEIKIGRWVNRVCTQLYKSSVNPSVIEKFVNLYKSTFDGEDISRFEIVHGEDIKKWYLSSNYESSNGQLGQSCMRHEYCQSFFDIYVKNPEVCQLLILKSDTYPDKISGRALLWKLTNEKYYLDRIYTNKDSDKLLFEDFANKKGVESTYTNFIRGEKRVQLGNFTYDEYPYMDTFSVYNPDTKMLSSNEDLWPGRGWIKIQDTHGEFLGDNFIWSEWWGDYVNQDTAVYCDNVDSWIPKDEAVFLDYLNEYAAPGDDIVYSSYHDQNFFKKDVVDSQIMADWLYPKDDDVIKVQAGVNKFDYIVKSKIDFLTKVGDEYYLKANYIKDPFTGEYHFKDEKIDGVYYYQYLDEKLYKELNLEGKTARASVNTIIEELKPLLKDFQITNEITEAIENNYIWKNKVKGVYWGIHKDTMPTTEHMFLIIKACVVANNDSPEAICKGVIDNFIDSKHKGRFLTYTHWGLMDKMIDVAKSFDYSLFSDDIYKRYLYLNI